MSGLGPTVTAGVSDRRSHLPRCRERGVVLLFVMIGLVLLLISATALIRSLDVSLVNAGNLAFRRDLVNQAERTVPQVMTAFTTGALSTSAARADHLQSGNYRASMLPVNGSGIPTALLDDTTFATVATTGNDITIADQGIRVRYVVDRLCNTTGDEKTIGTTQCMQADGGIPPGGSGSEMIRAEDSAGTLSGAVAPQVVYRISIRVDGPRATQAFLQTSFAL